MAASAFVARSSIVLCLLVSACGGGGSGGGASTTTSTTVAPVAESALDTLLLTPAEASAALGLKTDMTVAKTITTMDDGTGAADPAICLPVYAAALNAVYVGSGYTGMRDSYLTEAAPDAPSNLDQAVILFPSADQASAFYRNSVQRWRTCANRQFVAANSHVTWRVGPVTESDGTLSTLETEGTVTGDCERALTARNNVVIDVTSCDRLAPTNAGVPASKAIAAKVPH